MRGKSAHRVLVRALPDTFRADAQAAADAVVIDPASWGEPERGRPPLVEQLQDAVVRRRRLRLTYRPRTGEPGHRLVDPLGLVDKDNVWYLIAGTERGRRTYRVDRIDAAEPTGEPATRPAGFDLSEEWRDVRREVERHRARVSATVLVPASVVAPLRAQFGRYATVLGEQPDGRVRLRVAANLPVAIAEQLAGWGARVEVQAPESVRAELARIGAELLDRHRD